MRIIEASSEGKSPRSRQGQSPYKRTLLMVAAFLLGTGIVLADAPTATAATASTNNRIPFTSGTVHTNDCGGSDPGCDGGGPGCGTPGGDFQGPYGRGHRGEKHNDQF
jgi:hypothetical protein